VANSEVKPSMPLCVPEESSFRVWTTRASQELGIDVDPHSPYPHGTGVCRATPDAEGNRW